MCSGEIQIFVKNNNNNKNMSLFIMIFNEICEQITSERFGTTYIFDREHLFDRREFKGERISGVTRGWDT